MHSTHAGVCRASPSQVRYTATSDGPVLACSSLIATLAITCLSPSKAVRTKDCHVEHHLQIPNVVRVARDWVFGRRWQRARARGRAEALQKAIRVVPPHPTETLVRQHTHVILGLYALLLCVQMPYSCCEHRCVQSFEVWNVL